MKVCKRGSWETKVYKLSGQSHSFSFHLPLEHRGNQPGLMSPGPKVLGCLSVEWLDQPRRWFMDRGASLTFAAP